MTEVARLRVYLDTNFFIAAVEGSGALYDVAWRLLDKGERREGLLVTSELTLAEVLVKPFELQEGEGISAVMKRLASAHASNSEPPRIAPSTLATAYVELLDQQPGLTLAPVDRAVLVLSAYHRAEDKNIRLPDAIHLATAEQLECTHFVTGDRRVRSTSRFQFRRVDRTVNALDELMVEME